MPICSNLDLLSSVFLVKGSGVFPTHLSSQELFHLNFQTTWFTVVPPYPTPPITEQMRLADKRVLLCLQHQFLTLGVYVQPDFSHVYELEPSSPEKRSIKELDMPGYLAVTQGGTNGKGWCTDSEKEVFLPNF